MSDDQAQHAFVSYVHEDADAVDQLAAALQAASIPVWKDTQDLWPGEDWQIKIRQAIEGGSLAFIACFSTNSVQKNKSYMNAELRLAVEQIRLMKPGQVWLVPVRLDDCELPHFDIGNNRTLDSLQRIDLFGPNRDASLARLITAVMGIFGTSAAQSSTAATVVAADRYRLRDLHAEHSVPDMSLPAADQDMPAEQADVHDIDLVLRGRLLLTGPPGLPYRITESGRAAVLAALSGDQSLTGSGTLGRFLQQPGPHGQAQRNSWELHGHASTQEINARWIGPRHDNRTLARASLHVKLTPVPAHGDSLLARLDIQLTNPGRPRPPARDRPKFRARDFGDAYGILPKPLPSYGPFISLGFLGDLMLGILGTLWGPAGDTLATSVLGHGLGPPAQIDLTVFATRFSDNPETPKLDRSIDFGTARRISNSHPATWTQLGPLQPDRTLLGAAEQQRVVRKWLIQLGIDNGYKNVE